METLFGCYRAESGEAEIEGKKRTVKTNEAKKYKMAYITQERKILGLFLGLSVTATFWRRAQNSSAGMEMVQHQDIRENTEKYVDAMSIKINDANQNVMDLSAEGTSKRYCLHVDGNQEPDHHD